MHPNLVDYVRVEEFWRVVDSRDRWKEIARTFWRQRRTLQHQISGAGNEGPMKYTYFISLFVDGSGNCEATLDHPITGIDDLRALEQALREQQSAHGIILFYQLLRTEKP